MKLLEPWPKGSVLCQGAYRTFSDRCSWDPYFVSITSGTALLDSHKAIMTALEARASVAQPGKKARPDILYAYDWKSSRERIEYWVSRESDIAYAARIRVTHVPSMAEIERIARDEQNRYFSK